MATPQAELTGLRPHEWTVDEYYKMAELGLFDGKRVELIEGEIIEMSAMGRPHVIAVKKTEHALEVAFGAGWFVQPQAPLRFHPKSEPEPDLAVISGELEDYSEHPDAAALVVEISDTTLGQDRNDKGSLYAKAGIADYWIINLRRRQVEVFRRPVADEEAKYGFSYADRLIFKEGELVTPLAKPTASIAVADVLPRLKGGNP